MKFTFPTPEEPSRLFEERRDIKKQIRKEKETGEETEEVNTDLKETQEDIEAEIKRRYPKLLTKSEEGSKIRRLVIEEMKSERKEKKQVGLRKAELSLMRDSKQDALENRQHILVKTQGESDSLSMRSVAKLSARIDQSKEDLNNLRTNPENALITRQSELLLMHQDLVQKGYVFTPQLEREYEWLIGESTSCKPILLSGPTGTGKTEMVRNFTREFVGEDPIEIRGHENTRMEEFVGATGLRASNNTGIEDLLKKWNEARILAEQTISKEPTKYKDKEDKEQAFQNALSLVGQTIGITTETFREMGAIGKALEQSKRSGMSVLLIDELSRIPEDVVGGGLKGFFHELKKAKVLVVATANQKDAKHKHVRDVAPQEKREYEEHKFRYIPKGDLFDLSLTALMSKNGEIRASREELGDVLGNFITAVSEVQSGYVGKLTTAYDQKDTGLKATTLNSTVIEQGKILRWLVGFNESNQGLYEFISKKVGDYIANLHDGTREGEEDRIVIANIFATYGFDVPNSLKLVNFPLKNRYQNKTELTSLHKIALIDPYNQRPFVKEVETKPPTPPTSLTVQERKALGLEGNANQDLEIIIPDLEAQIESQFAWIRSSGILEALSSGKEGIKDQEGNEYPLPTREEISKALENQIEIIREKSLQGFKKLNLAPFALSPEKLNTILAQKLLDLHKQKKLKYEDGAIIPEDKLDTENPADIWDGYKDQEIVYFPNSFHSENHGGISKKDALKQKVKKGWTITLSEENTKYDPGADVGGRKQISIKYQDSNGKEITPNPDEYIEILGQNEYKYEEGLTIEEWFGQALENLEIHNSVTDDYTLSGHKVSWNLGTFFPENRIVSYACWDRDFRRSGVGGNGADRRGGGFRVRPVVRVSLG
jgi:DNA polymerase III delta prime subunit